MSQHGLGRTPAMPRERLPTEHLIDQFERLVYGRQIGQALEAALRLFSHFEALPRSSGILPDSAPKSDASSIYTRLASALIGLITAPELRMPPATFYRLCTRKNLVQSLFAASGFGGTEALTRLLSKPDSQGMQPVSPDALVRLCTVLALDDLPPEIMEATLRLPAKLLQPLMLGWLGQRSVLTAQGEANRSRLLAAGALIDEEPIKPELMESAVGAWMYCSYASAPHKHQIKRHLNRMFARFLSASGIESVRTPRRHRLERPTLLVIAERFRTSHAVYRCYAPSIRELAKCFRLVLVSTTPEFDQAAEDIFDEIVPLPPNGGRGSDLLAKITAIAPDIAYFPSLGMAPWAVLLANLRLAPIQIMSGGHPATSMSDHMDYYLLPRGMEPHADVYAETVIRLETNLLHQEHPAMPPDLRVSRHRDEGIVDIAINSKVMKLSHRQLDVCERLTAESSKRIRFQMFPGEWGVNFDGLRAMLSRRSFDAVVHPLQPYAEFMRSLARCELSLAAYPFGNSNSTVDALMLGIPVVAYAGTQPHSQTDRRIINSAGLPSWLVAEDDGAYFRAALRLIEHDDERAEISAHLEQCGIRERIYGTAESEHSDRFAAAFRWIYEYHETIQASGKRIVDAGEHLDAAAD